MRGKTGNVCSACGKMTYVTKLVSASPMRKNCVDITGNPYATPLTVRTAVVVESAFCSASSEVTNPDNANGRIKEHEINTAFGGDFSESKWDTDPTL